MSEPLTRSEARRLDSDAAFDRAVELGYVRRDQRQLYDDMVHVAKLRAAVRELRER